MTNYLANFQSLIEISIALNIAFIALNTISDKIKVSFASSIKAKVENTLDEIGEFEDTSNIHFKEMNIAENTKKDFQEKIQNILLEILLIEKRFSKRKESLFSEMMEFSKKFYIIVATYAIFILFFSGHLSCNIASTYTSFSIFTFSIFILIVFVYSKKLHLTLFQLPLYITAYFLIIMFLTYGLNMLIGDTYPICNIINEFFYKYHKIIVYFSISILYLSILISLVIFYFGKKTLNTDFDDKLNNVIVEKNKIDSKVKDINANKNIAEAAKEEADKLNIELSQMLTDP